VRARFHANRQVVTPIWSVVRRERNGVGDLPPLIRICQDRVAGLSFQTLHGPRGLPSAHDKISTIVKSRLSHTCRSVPLSVKNGAPSPIRWASGGPRQPDSADVWSGRLTACDPPQSAPGTTKWRFRPSKKRHLSPFSTPFLPIFSGFFPERSDQGANLREFDAEKRSSGTTPIRARTRCDLEPVTIPCPSSAAASLGPGLRSASAADWRRGGSLPSRSTDHHVQREMNEPQAQACFRDGRGQDHRGVGERQPGSRADGPALGQRARGPSRGRVDSPRRPRP